MRLTIKDDYRIEGYHKKEVVDTKGDLIEVEYYKNYDENTQEYSTLKVKETKVYERDPVLGLPTKQTETIEWFKSGKTVMATKVFTKHYDAEAGYELNQKAAKRLIKRASMYLASEVGADAAKALFRTFKAEVNAYHELMDRVPLIDAITNHTDPMLNGEFAYRKTVLVTILTVSYV